MKTLIIGLGAQKTASTWLSQILKTHPDCYVSPIKEMHLFNAIFDKGSEWRSKYFVNRLHEYISSKSFGEESIIDDELYALIKRVELVRRPELYEGYFEALAPDKKFYFDITPAYCNLPPRAYRYINEIVRMEKKYFFCMRNPIDRYWSHLKMQERRKSNVIAERDCIKLADKMLKDRGNYLTTLRCLEGGVEKSHYNVFFYENLEDIEALESVLRFIGVSYRDFPEKPVFKTSSGLLDSELRAKLFPKLESIYSGVYDFLDGALPESWIKDIEMYG